VNVLLPLKENWFKFAKFFYSFFIIKIILFELTVISFIFNIYNTDILGIKE